MPCHPVHFVTCFLKGVLPVFWYIRVTHEINSFIPPTRIIFLQRVQATNIITVTLGREALILGMCEVYTGNNE